MIKEQKIEEFLNDLASVKPTPGGGAVAALVAAEAAALVEMVVNLTKNEEFKHIGEKAHELRGQLLDLADADVAAFDEVMAAYKSKDVSAKITAIKKAIEVPTDTKELACLVQKLAKSMIENGNKNAVSDAKTALHLAEAAEKSAQENININHESLTRLEGQVVSC